MRGSGVLKSRCSGKPPEPERAAAAATNAKNTPSKLNWRMLFN
jgi:hypothetical protein